MTARGSQDDLVGILVVDKPAGLTSHDVVDAVRRRARLRRVGHTGTLDPDATGVLVLCLGRAAKLVRFLQMGAKTYEGTMRLGVETTTQDAAGDVVAEQDASGVTEAGVRRALAQLTGEIDQIPPMVSAVKVGGRRLHELARRGEIVDRPSRRVIVHRLELTAFEPGPGATASFTVDCSAGTYVRTLAHDAGRTLGVGAHLTALRRTRNGGFTLEDARPLADLPADPDGIRDLMLEPLQALRSLPQVEVDPAEAARLVHGVALAAQHIEGPYAVTVDGRLVGVYQDRDERGKAEVVLLRPDDLQGEAR